VFGNWHEADRLGRAVPACEDPLVKCDVCGEAMWRWPVPPPAWEEEIWSCPWCHAVVDIGGELFEISRPPYLPMEMRWERAVAGGLSADASHAFGIFDRTLCGIQENGMSPSDH
jgi:hypothetical protein